jgi:hypothetical protein
MSRFDRLREPAQTRGSVLRAAASEDDIRRAEERLAATLPPSYRSFLLMSDGAYASALGAEIQYPFADVRHGLLRVSDIELTVNADPIGVDVWCDQIPELNDPANDVPSKPGEPQDVGYYAPYRDGVVITHIHNGTNRLALVPRDGEEEWELWDFAWEGATGHASFADFLWWYVGRPERRRPQPEDADALASTFRTSGTWTLDNLAELGDTRVFELARECVESGRFCQDVARLLGQMAAPEGLPLLRELYRSNAEWVVRVQTLGALEQAHAEDLDEFLHDALNDEDENVRSWASGRLAAR